MFEFRGIDNLYVAKVITDTVDSFVCETPVKLSDVAQVTKSTESSSEAHYYDNQPKNVVNAEGVDTITLIIAPPELAMLSKITGRSYDSETAMMVESERTNDYFAIMYRTKGTDKRYRYVSRLKGQFNLPDEDVSTEDNGTGATNTSIEFTGVYTDHVFTKGVYVDGAWQPSTAKAIVVDTKNHLANVTNWFTAIQTPDTVSTSATLGQLDVFVVEGSASGYTQVDSVTPLTASGNKLVYKIGTSAETVTYDASLTTGWTSLQFDTDISATEGQVITVAEVTRADSKARKAGNTTVVVTD